jgi:hypothetical protein
MDLWILDKKNIKEGKFSRGVSGGGMWSYGRGIRKLSPGPWPITSHRAQRHPFLPLASSTRTALPRTRWILLPGCLQISSDITIRYFGP